MKQLFFYGYKTAFCLLLTLVGMAQEDFSKKASQPVKSPDELLDLFSVGTAVGAENASVPKVIVKTYKFSALIGNKEWDFNLYNSVPALSVNNKEGEQYMRNDLVRNLGGAINVSFGRTGYFANGKDPSLTDIKGARFEFKMGGKVLDAFTEETKKRNFVPVLQSTINCSYMIPLFERQPKGKNEKRLRDLSIGNLSFRFIGGMMYVLTNKEFNFYYSTRKGVPPQALVMAGTLDVFFYITNKIYVNFGYSKSNQEIIKPLPYLAISYGKSL